MFIKRLDTPAIIQNILSNPPSFIFKLPTSSTIKDNPKYAQIFYLNYPPLSL